MKINQTVIQTTPMNRRARIAIFGFCAALLGAFACDSDEGVNGGKNGDGDGDGQDDGMGGSEGTSDIDVGLGLGGNEGEGGATIGTEIMIVKELPEGFVEASGSGEAGGWKVIGSVDEVDLKDSLECANILRVIARDFPESHPDFEQGSTGLQLGMVKDELGEDRKPVLADESDPNDLVTDANTFNQWYRNEEGANLPFVMDLWLEPVGETFVFDSSTFFPLGDVGFALQEGGPGQSDGFHFTTELHTSFQYKGGEEFSFRGDDDVWVYINGRLAIDLGGVHGPEAASVKLEDIADAFGLEVGEVYDLDLFQAERQTSGSNFRIETTLDFTNCGKVLPGDIPVR